jgi:hypothetical protein
MSDGREKMRWAKPGTTKETMKGRERTEREVERWVSSGLYAHMKAALAGKNKKTLLREAAEIANRTGVPKPPRLACRERPVLVAWFCEHCPERAQLPITDSPRESFVLDGTDDNEWW